jgi:hypothetical protein
MLYLNLNFKLYQTENKNSLLALAVARADQALTGGTAQVTGYP